MKRLFGITVYISLVVVMMISFGCSSNELSRSEAKKIINKVLIGDGKEYTDFRTGFVFCKHWSVEGFGGLEQSDYKQLEQSGLIKLQDLGKTIWGVQRYFVSIPEDVQKIYLKSVKKGDKVDMDGKTYTKDTSTLMVSTDQCVNEITGIRQEGKEIGAKAIVEFTLKQKFTPFGNVSYKKEFIEKSEKGILAVQVGFEKYDDGWRIQEKSLKIME